MATNPYFNQKSPQEQGLYEDIIIESLKMMGQDVYYLPREVVRTDDIFSDQVLSRFEHAYKIEMYIENVDGWEGDGDLFQKFGIELRDQGTFVLARKRWKNVMRELPNYEEDKYYRPREGDLIHLPLSNSTFEISKVDTEAPFYQLGDLPVFRLQCQLFEYSDEDFDTNITDIDDIEDFATYQYVLTLDSASNGYIKGENVSQTTTDYTLTGEVVSWNLPDLKVYLAHVGSTDGNYHTFNDSDQITSSVSLSAGVEELQKIQDELPDFTAQSFEFADWSEANPFGDY
jgi:hypothetical protein